MNQWAGIDQSV